MKIRIAVSSAILIFTLILFAPNGRTLAYAQTSAPEAQPLHILLGKSVIINVQNRLTRVMASNPAVIETFATSPMQLVVDAKAAGSSSLILWDITGHTRMLDVTVDLDLSGLRAAIQEAYPHDKIDVESDKGRIIVSGTAKGQAASDDLMKMAGIYSKDVVNSLLIPPPGRAHQILLEVKFAEVDRSKLDQTGFNLFSTGATNTLGTVSTQQLGPVSGQGGGPISITTTAGAAASLTGLGLTNPLNLFLFRPDINLGAVIALLEQKTVLQILSEPNIMTVEGKKASFLAGGEFPFPVVQGGQSIGVVTIQFRPFGVKLDFTGFVSEDNVIRLQVSPEVSTLDYADSVTISGFTVPAISTRRADTEIELRDGQSFGIAGLMDQRVTAEMSKIPGIGDIPILGQLFRSKSVTRSHQELLVLVTPHIVDPVGTGAKPKAVPEVAMPYLKTPKFDKDLPGNKELQNQAQPTAPKEKP